MFEKLKLLKEIGAAMYAWRPAWVDPLVWLCQHLGSLVIWVIAIAVTAIITVRIERSLSKASAHSDDARGGQTPHPAKSGGSDAGTPKPEETTTHQDGPGPSREPLAVVMFVTWMMFVHPKTFKRLLHQYLEHLNNLDQPDEKKTTDDHSI